MTTALTNRLTQSLSPIFSRDPFTTLQREMEDAIGRLRTDWNGDSTALEIVPSIDLSETNEAIQIRMDVPGIKAEEISVEVTGNTLRVSGERKEEKEVKGRTYHRLERRSGSFARTISLPASVKENQVSAECKEGVLTIILPKSEVAKTQKVKVVSKQA